jgi:hypothetical protein
MGPAVIVSGCVSPTARGDENEAFTLNATSAAVAISESPAPQGVRDYRLEGSTADLRRHAGHRVEIIGLIQEETASGSAPLTLDVKSMRAIAESCDGS